MTTLKVLALLAMCGVVVSLLWDYSTARLENTLNDAHMYVNRPLPARATRVIPSQHRIRR
jgi:hypothetical protein